MKKYGIINTVNNKITTLKSLTVTPTVTPHIFNHAKTHENTTRFKINFGHHGVTI